MLNPSAFYRFSHLHKTNGGDVYRFCFAYKPPGFLVPGALDELILAMCKGPHMPDAVVVLSIGSDSAADTLKMLREDNAKVAQQRLKSRIPLLHAAYNLRTGALDISLLDDHFIGRKKALFKVCQDIGSWIKSGLRELFAPDDVILRAPSGYAYEKPSGARAKIFLKPDMALKSSASVAFVALALFNKVFSGKLDRFPDLRTVFIDTMAIAPVVYALRELLVILDAERHVRIESFHSYGGFDEVVCPLPGTSLCVISASTSMDLHGKWISDKQTASHEVVTLLTLQSASHHKDGALFLLAYDVEPSAVGPVQLCIRIRGESFLPEQESPKKILLTDQYHRCNDSVEHFYALSGSGIFDIYRKSLVSTGKVRAVYVDGDILIKHENFIGWLKKNLLQSVKAATKTIIYQNDRSSRELASDVSAYCLEAFGLNLAEGISLNELGSADIDPSGGAIICAAVVGKGSQLLEISRTLRDKHNGPRLYILGFQVTESGSELRGLVSNLRHAKEIPHDLIRFGGAATGTQLLACFESECSMFYTPSLDISTLPDAMRRRVSAIGSSGKVGHLALLPHGGTVSESMQLRQGFAYWPPDFKTVSCQPEVIATMAVLLQRARESEKVPEERRLSTASFRQVVLDPENFSRFNDGVIQAAIIRNAYPSELDYRSDHAASDFMKAVIIRALKRADEESGEAALEFVMALELRKIQLSQQHREEVVATARAMAGSSSDLGRALSFIFNFEENRKSKLPF